MSNSNNTPELHAVVAIDEQGAIGRDGGLLCHLSADLRHFKAVTMGHSIIMGRRTFESFPKGALPGRQNIVVTRNPGYAPAGADVAHSIEQALALVRMPQPAMVIGGGEIYAALFPLVTTLHLTRIHATFPGADTYFPAIDPAQWREAGDAERHEPDDRNPHPYTFVTLVRDSHQQSPVTSQ